MLAAIIGLSVGAASAVFALVVYYLNKRVLHDVQRHHSRSGE